MSNLVFTANRAEVEFEITKGGKVLKCKWQEMSPKAMQEFLKIANEPDRMIEGLESALKNNLKCDDEKTKKEVIDIVLNEMGVNEAFAMLQSLNEAIAKIREGKSKE